MRSPIVATCLAVLVMQGAYAGAWTLHRGKVQLLTGVTSSRASHRFDGHGEATESVIFNKLLIQSWLEYGLTDWVTLYCAPEYVLADSGTSADDLSHFKSTSVEAGARVRLVSRRLGVVSIQLSGKTAGAFDMSVSAGGQAGTQFELRALYGRTFKLLGRDGFVDIEAAERWIGRPRPNEMTVDATAGVWVTKDYLLMLQSFNTISGSGAKAPYTYYRLHKLELSLVQPIARHWYLQGGYFFAPSGQNIVQEQGFISQIWYKT